MRISDWSSDVCSSDLAQGYFVYDSHKSGAETISHLRFGNTPIAAPYLLSSVDFIGVHRFEFLDKLDVLRHARDGATVLINAPYDPADVWNHLRRPVQQHILEKRLRLFVIDASGVAQLLGLGPRVNTILQACFFAISGILPGEEGIRRIRKRSEEHTSELQSLMRISYAVFCLKKKNTQHQQ